MQLLLVNVYLSSQAVFPQGLYIGSLIGQNQLEFDSILSFL